MLCCLVELIWTVPIVLVLGFIVQDWLGRRKRSGAAMDGEHVVITGGSSGIGLELACKAVQRGANVTILARDLKKLEDACKVIRSHVKSSSQSVNYFQLDVTNYEDVEKVLHRCEVEFSPIDILVASAGYSYPSKLEDIPVDHIKGLMNINYLGTVYPVRCVLPSMKSRRKGKIVCVSSIAGLVGVYGFTAYGASKFAVRGFAEALQMEVKPYGIGVTVAFPPDTDTPCLAEENKLKPKETKLISESGGLFSADKVADDILRDTLAGDFFCSTGLDGNLSTIVTVGMAPMSSAFGLVIQVLFGGILRLVSLGYLYSFNRTVAKCVSSKDELKKSD